MSKMRVLLVGATAAGAFAAASFIPANAASTPTPVAQVHYGQTPSGGYIVLQGDGTAPVPTPINNGYIGVDSNSDSGLVGCADGTYVDGSGESAINVPPSTPDPNDTDPCTP